MKVGPEFDALEVVVDIKGGNCEVFRVQGACNALYQHHCPTPIPYDRTLDRSHCPRMDRVSGPTGILQGSADRAGSGVQGPHSTRVLEQGTGFHVSESWDHSPVRVLRVHRVSQATDSVHHWHGPVRHGIELVQAAGLKAGGHQQQVGGCNETVRHRHAEAHPAAALLRSPRLHPPKALAEPPSEGLMSQCTLLRQ